MLAAVPSLLNLGLLVPKEPQQPPLKYQCLSKSSGSWGLDTPFCVALGEPLTLSEPQSKPLLAGQSTKVRRWGELSPPVLAGVTQGDVAFPLGTEVKRSGRNNRPPRDMGWGGGTCPGAPAPPFQEAPGPACPHRGWERPRGELVTRQVVYFSPYLYSCVQPQHWELARWGQRCQRQ